ncbi:hypothetical protein GDO81_023406 [Engystomops pustulosus]|uniref:Uncharacterized protein n=1 Tax=Engystomops pustulosus TaxID=76066 RepID=A0AAV6Z969_ENGPU|nr:hypothetical protein GDO81_023406 [Engystomops pustulosus]
MSSFLLSTANQQEISALDNKIHETIESINQLKIQRDFMLSFSRDPKGYIQDWLLSQSRDLKIMTDVVGNPEQERRADFYQEPWSQEAVSRYFYCKVKSLSVSSSQNLCEGQGPDPTEWSMGALGRRTSRPADVGDDLQVAPLLYPWSVGSDLRTSPVSWSESLPVRVHWGSFTKGGAAQFSWSVHLFGGVCAGIVSHVILFGTD